MDMSFHLNSTFGIRVPTVPKTMSSKKNLQISPISCLALRNSSNLYELLSLGSKNVSLEEIKKAYRSLARKHHPDLFPSFRKEEATRKFVEIQNAYDTLSDPISRKNYDRELSLAGAIDDEVRRVKRNEARCMVSKVGWQNQLNGLKERSNRHLARKK